MNKLLYKELRLAASPLSYFFIAFALMTFLPGYPILLGAFFTTLGIFQSFRSMRENNDIAYSLLLPVAKADIVRSKFAFAVFIELCSFAVMLIATLIRMALLPDAPVYTQNALMGANFSFLGFALLVFGLFNLCFLRGFFKTAYHFTKPFVVYCIVSFLTVAAAETLWHLPGFAAVNTLGFAHMGLQLGIFFAGALLSALLTLLALRASVKSFECIDL